MCRELGRLAQGFDEIKGTNTIKFLTLDEIRNIPADRKITYARIIVDYRPHKPKEPNRVRLTVGGNLVECPGKLTTRTAGLTATKILWNSVISTDNARFITADVKNFYLGAPLDRYEYMRMKLDLMPEEYIEQNNLREKAKNGYFYMEIQKGMYGLPQAGILANKLLRKRLAKHGYIELPHTPGLWRHIERPVWFTLVVDDFGIKYVGEENAKHLLNALRNNYTIETDWTGSLYCRISLTWNYNKKYVDIAMPNYVLTQLTKYNRPPPPSVPNIAPIPQPR